MSQSGLNAVGTRLQHTLLKLNLSVLGGKHALFHIQTSEGYENNKHKMLMTVEMSIEILIRKGLCVL